MALGDGILPINPGLAQQQQANAAAQFQPAQVGLPQLSEGLLAQGMAGQQAGPTRPMIFDAPSRAPAPASAASPVPWYQQPGKSLEALQAQAQAHANGLVNQIAHGAHSLFGGQ